MVLGQSAQGGPVGQGVWLSRGAFQPQLLRECQTPLELPQTIVYDVSEDITQQQKVTAQIQERSAKFYYPLLVL